MIFNTHSDLVGKHAIFGASKGSWVNYDDDKILSFFDNTLAAKRGTRLHTFAAEAIDLGVKLQGKTTLAMYVNDCIGWKLKPEQPLAYISDRTRYPNFFGTADAIGYKPPRGTALGNLKVSDYKSGVSETTMRQLKIYVALFCLEYRFRPFEIDMEMRIYQNDEILFELADPDEIFHFMDRIVSADKLINQYREEVQ